MTKYHSRWHINPMLIPTKSEERAKLWVGLLERVKADMKSGDILDGGITPDLTGYTIRETEEVSLSVDVLKYAPFIITDVKPILTPDQALESIKRAAVAAKK